MKIIQSYLTKNPCYKAGKKITIKGLMLHSVGCPQPSASAFVKKWNDASYSRACVHGFIDANTGDVYQTLPWNHRGWHAGGSANNTHIGVEMCEPSCIKYDGTKVTVMDMTAAKACVKRTYNTAVELFAQLCKQYNLDPLKDITGHKEGHTKGIASNHADPDHLWKAVGLSYTMNGFRNDVKATMSTSVKIDNENAVWGFLQRQGLTCEGAAGLMGNLQVESNFEPTNLQNSYEKKLGMTDAEYTRKVDDGSYKNFATDSAGYGLAQWTYHTRKESLLKYAREKKTSIGDLQTQLEFLMKELKGEILNVLKSTHSVREASDIVLLKFERPKDQSEDNQIRRASYGQKIFEKYASRKVKINVDELNVRKGAGIQYDITTVVKLGEVYTIVEEKDGWGKLKSGSGWIKLSYTVKV